MKKIILIFIAWLGLIYPELGIENDKQYFSPNLDGVKDVIEIPFKIKEENLTEWRVLILEKTGPGKFKRIRTIQSENPKKQNLNFEKFFKRIFAKDKIIANPDLVSWDGKDGKYEALPDGIYYLKIFAEDKFGNKEESGFIPIILDTEPPKVTVKLREEVFSPNNDGRKEELLIDINVNDFREFDKWSLTFLGKDNQKVFNAEGDKSTLFEWRGVNDQGKLLKEGNYKMEVFAYDLAGNKSQLLEDDVNLVTDFEKASLVGSRKIFSPNEDGYFDSVEFTSELSSVDGLEKWDLELFDKDGKKVVKLNEGDAFVEKITFNGATREGKALKDGLYTARATAKYDSGNLIKSNPVMVEVDNTAPTLEASLENKVFNPLAKNRGDKAVRISQGARGGKRDNYRAIIKNQNGEIVFVKDFGNKLPKKFSWDGSNENKERIGGDYTYTLVGEDEVANVAVLETAPFSLITENLNVDFEAVNSSFSPNDDNRLDTANFVLEVDETYRKLFQKGEIRFLNDKKKLVKKIPVEKINRNWQWDGRNDDNEVLPDGKYFYTFKAAFTTKEEVTLPLKQLYLDTTPVNLTVKAEERIFSPNGDGNLDTMKIENALVPSQLKKEQDKFNLKIKNEKGEVFKQFNWVGNIPKKVIWRGTGNGKEIAPEGKYIYELATLDHAQNQKIYRSDPFRLVREIEELELALSDKVLSQVPEAKVKTITITPELSSRQGLEKVDYYLTQKNNNFEKYLFSENDLTPIVLNLEKEKALPSGGYELASRAFFDSGNKPNNLAAMFIDNLTPEVKSLTEPDLFSPDGDGRNETLNIRFLARDNYGLKKIDSWIFRKVQFLNKKPFQQNLANYLDSQLPLENWSWQKDLGKNFSETKKWNGQGQNDQRVESATEYIVFTRAEDEVGLVTMGASSFLVDILVEELPDGRLRIILNNINFEFDSDLMIGDYRKTLALLIRMLNRFPTYKIDVVGHTDSRGSESYNQNLSVKRAKRVLDFLKKNGVTRGGRLNYEGVGESDLLVKEEVVTDESLDPRAREQLTEENYRKNRRVEFYLQKEE